MNKCPATVPPKPNFSPTGLVIGPSTSELTPTQVMIWANDPALKSTWAHKFWVACGCAMVLASLAKSILTIGASYDWAKPVLGILVGYVSADLGSGVYHWAIDNYGDYTTPVFGPQIEGFQGHHKWPQKITMCEFANNIYPLAISVAMIDLPLILIVGDPFVLAFIGSSSGFSLFSQQFHAWAHTRKTKLPKIVVGLQELGLLISRPQHSAHHKPPYNGNYCIVSGICNKTLDKIKVFEKVEIMLFFILGVKPRSWAQS